MVNNRYRDSYQEVYVILEHLDYEDYKKIPQEILNAIDNNRNKDYQYELKDDFELTKQQMMPETKATLFNLYRDYFGTPEQKEIIIKFQKAERREIEKIKSEKYHNNFTFKSNNEKNTEIENNKNQSSLALIKIEKDNLFLKFIRKIKRFFGR
mgnify:CR=1 FL=1